MFTLWSSFCKQIINSCKSATFAAHTCTNCGLIRLDNESALIATASVTYPYLHRHQIVRSYRITMPKRKASANGSSASKKAKKDEAVAEPNDAKQGKKETKKVVEKQEPKVKETKEKKTAQKAPLKKKASSREHIPDVSGMNFSSDKTTKDGKKWNLKLSSWNVNGIRAWAEKNGHSFIKADNPDIFCLQETKCDEANIPDEVKLPGYHTYFLSGDKDGYSGTGLYSKVKPLDVKYGLGIKKHDGEGRVITAEYEKFYFVTAYVPNSGRGLPRLPYRSKEWDVDFREYLKNLDKKKPVIMCGDLNVSHLEIDLANPKTNTKTAGFTKEEREGFTDLLSAGFIDSFRHLYPDVTGAYSYWTYMNNARAKNTGWRLDYFVLSERLKNSLCDSTICKDVMGSDHCPITLYMHI